MWPVDLGTESQLNHWDYLQGRGSSQIRAEVQFLEAGMDVLAGKKIATGAVGERLGSVHGNYWFLHFCF